jgi:multidrug efflux pump
MISRFCIQRPIFAVVLSAVIVIAGVGATMRLPIAQYPDISPPVVTVTAAYPGADADTIAQAVAAPIETQVNGVDNMLYMESSCSSAGQYSLSITFQVGTDPDKAQVQVQNRMSLALPLLPDTVQRGGVQTSKSSGNTLMIIAIYSPDGRYDAEYVGNYANLYVLDAIKRVPGANGASIMGTPDLAMRIWLKPDRMASLGIASRDIVLAVSTQNQQFSAGSIGSSPANGSVAMTFPVVPEGRFSTPQDFEDIILRADPNGVAIVRLKDVARVEVGLKDYILRTKLNGKPATLINIFQQAGANALTVAKNVRQTLDELKRNFPQGLDYTVSLDTTKFVEASIKEVEKTLLEAALLVVAVVFLFLQSLRATIIPTLAVVVSLLGTFIGMLLLGFSINLLTLFGLVVAIGIVVDDAIVVVEAVEHNMAAGNLSARDATFRAMEQVSGPVIAVVLVLAAVFIPTAAISGATGQLYKQFAVTIALSVAISGFVALTLTPALCAIWLKPHQGARRGLFGWFNRGFDRVTNLYGGGVRQTIRRWLLALGLLAIMLFCTWRLFNTVPSSFVPAEDQGYLLVAAILPDGASLDRADKVCDQISEIFTKEPEVKDASTFAGFSLLDGQLKARAGTLFVSLKDFEERKGSENSSFALLDRVRPKLAAIKEAIVIPVNPPSIPGLGGQGGFEFWIQSRGESDAARLQETVAAFLAKASQRPELNNLSATLDAASRQLRLRVDRAKAETLGVPIQDVYDAVQTFFGSLSASQYTKYSRVWQVVLQADAQYRAQPSDIENIYVGSRSQKMVPLSALVTTSYGVGPDLIQRFNNVLSVRVNGSAASGFSSGQAIAAMEAVAHEVLPEGYSFQWSGQALEEKKSASSSTLVFGLGAVFVFLILAAQYESWGLPMAVITAVPFAIFGAILGVWLRGLDNDVYFQIGLVTLIGLASKNAILIVEFAALRRREGLSIRKAALDAAQLRLRPIIMTSLAFIFGMIPLFIAAGPGSNSRHSVATGIIGGMLMASSIALFFVPMFFYLIQSGSERFGSANKGAPKILSETAAEGPTGGLPATRENG